MRRDEPAPVVLVAERGYAGTLEKRISGFTLEQRTADRVRIRADFGLEARPKWLQETRRNRPGFDLVPLDVSAGEVAHAAEAWMHSLAEFPSVSGSRGDRGQA